MVLTIVLICVLFGSSIAFHELGHYLAAVRGKLNVTKFAIGFGPKLWSRKLASGTDIELRAIPLGGFVQIPDLEQKANPQGLGTISRKTRFNVFIAGVTFNIIFAFALGTLLWIIGLPASYSYQSTRIGYVAPTMDDHPSPAFTAGLRSGDEIVSIDGNVIHSWTDLVETVVLGTRGKESVPVITLGYHRNNAPETQTVSFKPYIDSEGIRKIGILPYGPAIVGQLSKYGPADRAHLPIGARIISVNGHLIHSIYEYGKFEDAGVPMAVTYVVPTTLQQKIDDDLTHFTAPSSPLIPHTVTIIPEKPLNHPELQSGILWSSDFDIYIAHNDPFTAVYKAIRTTFRTLHSLLSPNSSIGLRHMSGPVGITTAYYSLGQEDWRYMVWFTLVLNVSLAISNLLPLPILDGGHLFFLGIESLRRKQPSAWMYEAINRLQSACTILLICFALYITYHDIARAANTHKEAPYENPTFKVINGTY